MAREEFMDIVYSELHSDGDNCRSNRIIDAADEYAEGQNRWIPVSERLPEVGQRIIATIESIDGNYVRETIYDKHGFLCGKGIAWMPLPEPYLPDINVGKMSEIPTGSEGSDKE